MIQELTTDLVIPKKKLLEMNFEIGKNARKNCISKPKTVLTNTKTKGIGIVWGNRGLFDTHLLGDQNKARKLSTGRSEKGILLCL